MAVEDTFATLSAVPVDALVTSKKWTATENTIRFAQEIYDASGHLVAVHEKFPVDLVHRQP